MGRNGDHVQDSVYTPFIKGMGFADNTAINRKGALARMYMRLLSGMSMARFKWCGMPDEIDLRFLEMTLMQRGLCVFYFDDDYERFMALKGTGAANINMYDNPTKFQVYGNLMLNKTLDAKHCVPIWGNNWRVPDWDTLMIYATKLAEIDRTIEINMLNVRHPVLLAVNQNERLTLQNMFRQVEEGAPVIFGTEAMVSDNIDEKIRALDLGTKDIDLTSIMTVKSRIWNEALTLLGIHNVNDQKRERMVVEEAAGASGQVLAMRASAMQPREAAAQQINDMYGLQVSVEWDMDSSADMPSALPIGVNNG